MSQFAAHGNRQRLHADESRLCRWRHTPANEIADLVVIFEHGGTRKDRFRYAWLSKDPNRSGVYIYNENIEITMKEQCI